MILGIPGMTGLFMWIESEEFGRQIKSVILVYFGTINSASCSIHSCIVHHGSPWQEIGATSHQDIAVGSVGWTPWAFSSCSLADLLDLWPSQDGIHAIC